MNNATEAPEFPAGMYGIGEERANRVTHGIGFVLSVVGTVYLFATMPKDSNWIRWISCGIYTASLMAVYAASTLSHGPFDRHWRNFFRSVDQGCIYFLIAGTCTPMAIHFLPPFICGALLGAMWTIAAVGFITKVYFIHRVDAVSVWIYLLLGWLPILASPWFISSAPPLSMYWSLAGGLCYTMGTPFLVFDKRVPYFHSVWHLCVMSGSTLHFLCILHFVAWA